MLSFVILQQPTEITLVNSINSLRILEDITL